jgi:phosphoribosylamine--glycine ligase
MAAAFPVSLFPFPRSNQRDNHETLVIGSGGREHALAWRLKQSPRLQKVYVAPGNGGTAREEGVENVAISGIPELVEFALKEGIQLTVVGPEAPLAAGVVDAFRAAGLKIFGPTRAAAQLESSKDFAKQFMARHKIPTAAFGTFTDAAAAHAYIDAQGAPIVVKADGLAAGKGVVVARRPRRPTPPWMPCCPATAWARPAPGW